MDEGGVSAVMVHLTDYAEGVAFADEGGANAWLTTSGYQRRASQPGQWVKLLQSGNLFASVTRPDNTVWSR